MSGYIGGGQVDGQGIQGCPTIVIDSASASVIKQINSENNSENNSPAVGPVAVPRGTNHTLDTSVRGFYNNQRFFLKFTDRYNLGSESYFLSSGIAVASKKSDAKSFKPVGNNLTERQYNRLKRILRIKGDKPTDIRYDSENNTFYISTNDNSKNYREKTSKRAARFLKRTYEKNRKEEVAAATPAKKKLSRHEKYENKYSRFVAKVEESKTPEDCLLNTKFALRYAKRLKDEVKIDQCKKDIDHYKGIIKARKYEKKARELLENEKEFTRKTSPVGENRRLRRGLKAGWRAQRNYNRAGKNQKAEELSDLTNENEIKVEENISNAGWEPKKQNAFRVWYAADKFKGLNGEGAVLVKDYVKNRDVLDGVVSNLGKVLIGYNKQELISMQDKDYMAAAITLTETLGRLGYIKPIEITPKYIEKIVFDYLRTGGEELKKLIRGWEATDYAKIRIAQPSGGIAFKGGNIKNQIGLKPLENLLAVAFDGLGMDIRKNKDKRGRDRGYTIIANPKYFSLDPAEQKKLSRKFRVHDDSKAGSLDAIKDAVLYGIDNFSNRYHIRLQEFKVTHKVKANRKIQKKTHIERRWVLTMVEKGVKADVRGARPDVINYSIGAHRVEFQAALRILPAFAGAAAHAADKGGAELAVRAATGLANGQTGGGGTGGP